jgi:hypothetical protein
MSVTLPILRDDDAAIVEPTAPSRDGTRNAAAPDAANTKATQRRPVAEHGRNNGYLPRYGGNSSMRSTTASHSAQRFATSALTSTQVWGLAKTDQEWSEKLDTALTAARRDDLEHGTNAADKHGCVCQECRQHQSIRMGRNRG